MKSNIDSIDKLFIKMLRDYRIRADMAYSDVLDGVVAAKAYKKALERLEKTLAEAYSVYTNDLIKQSRHQLIEDIEAERMGPPAFGADKETAESAAFRGGWNNALTQVLRRFKDD